MLSSPWCSCCQELSALEAIAHLSFVTRSLFSLVSKVSWWPAILYGDKQQCELFSRRRERRRGREGKKKGKKERWGQKQEVGLRGTKAGKEWKGNCFLNIICSGKSQSPWSMPLLNIRQSLSTGLCHFQCTIEAYPLTTETGRMVCDSCRTAVQLCQLQCCHCIPM